MDTYPDLYKDIYPAASMEQMVFERTESCMGSVKEYTVCNYWDAYIDRVCQCQQACEILSATVLYDHHDTCIFQLFILYAGGTVWERKAETRNVNDAEDGLLYYNDVSYMFLLKHFRRVCFCWFLKEEVNESFSLYRSAE